MKVLIDLIEDIQTTLDNMTDFTLAGMGLKEDSTGEFEPQWKSSIVHYRLDDKEKKFFLFLGQNKPLKIADLLSELNSYSNEAMMYEICLTYTQDDQRLDKKIIGFGESIPEKKYLLFVDVDN